MNVWAQIDELKKRHEKVFADTAAELEAEPLKAIRGSLTTDDAGWWICRYIAAGDGRTQSSLQARSAEDLVRKLKEIRTAEAQKAADAKRVSVA